MRMKQGGHDARSVHAAEPSYAIVDGCTQPMEGTVSVPQFKFTSRCRKVFGHSSYPFWNFTKIYTSFPVSTTHQTFKKIKSASLQTSTWNKMGKLYNKHKSCITSSSKFSNCFSWNLKYNICTTADMVSHWLLNTKAWIWSQGSLYAICGRQSDNEKNFHKYCDFSVNYHSINIPNSYWFIYQCYIM
jgi:hypothetical protein